ncbi:secreted protein [Candidatus Magnetoovum chiemensis]|nr:secreted protein [Candidatus Magnetoovum chiemensis]
MTPSLPSLPLLTSTLPSPPSPSSFTGTLLDVSPVSSPLFVLLSGAPC